MEKELEELTPIEQTPEEAQSEQKEETEQLQADGVMIVQTVRGPESIRFSLQTNDRLNDNKPLPGAVIFSIWRMLTGHLMRVEDPSMMQPMRDVCQSALDKEQELMDAAKPKSSLILPS